MFTFTIPVWSAMRRFWPRLLTTVLPVALICGAAGYLYAVGAGAYVSGKQDDGSTLRDVLVWRVPFAMAIWGGLFTLLVEVFRHLWAPKKIEKQAAPTPNPEADAEKLLLQLLEQAEQAEESRKFPPPPAPPVTDTPLPASLPSVDSQPTPVS